MNRRHRRAVWLRSGIAASCCGLRAAGAICIHIEAEVIKGHSKRCAEFPPPWPFVLVSEEMVVRCLMLCTKAVLVILKSWRLEIECPAGHGFHAAVVLANPSTRKVKSPQ
jgi:hypothetical protein